MPLTQVPLNVAREMLSAEQKETPYKSLTTPLYAGWVQKREKAQGKRNTSNVKYI